MAVFFLAWGFKVLTRRDFVFRVHGLIRGLGFMMEGKWLRLQP